MTVITKKGEIADAYVRADTLETAFEADGIPLIPASLVDEYVVAKPGTDFGLSVPGSMPIEDLVPYLAQASLIAIEFPGFSDGRGFSLARRVKREGFAGRLRASGPLIADQFTDALQCGFDEVELPETMTNRQPVQQWMEAKDTITDFYQSGYGEGLSILEKRRAARKGARP
ncbi:DUF934 domain-containing protein [Jiella marina]|uniref:DUF934 domain-containing protein n=1 Tax=Jiella sp. LLJ827 TaxID=2917712 RepID=UPI002101086B|nr:DUF934 domain-containing protein [Jiella sp. LLJ827]MCQ0988931.1 DUF934 domain-containing protein [Jiella sp. LLJ827]